MQCSALFLDRDGVINVDRGYIYRSAQFEFVPGIFELARFWTNELCRPIVVITNQSGIGRGHFDGWAYEDLTRWMCERLPLPLSPPPWHRPVPPRSSVAQAQPGYDIAGRVRP